MQVTNPGSAGSGTVTTDGVTIQGDGSGGNPIAIKNAETDGVTMQGAGTVASKIAIKQVQTLAGLTGAGTVASPLAQTPLGFFGFLARATAGGTITSNNTIWLSGFVLPYPLTFSKLNISISTADGVSNSDFGVYSAAGSLVANVGAATYGSTGSVTVTFAQGVQTIQPGLYLVAMTSTGTTLKLNFSNSVQQWFSNQGYGSSSGGVLPNSIAAPTLTLGANIVPAFLF